MYSSQYFAVDYGDNVDAIANSTALEVFIRNRSTSINNLGLNLTDPMFLPSLTYPATSMSRFMYAAVSVAISYKLVSL